MTTNRVIQRTAKAAHVETVRAGHRLKLQIDERADRVKAAIRILLATKEPIDQMMARRMFDRLQEEIEKLIRDAAAFQAGFAYKAVAKSMTQTVPGAVVQPLSDEQQQPEHTNYLGPVAGILALWFAATMTLRHGSNDAIGMTMADMAINRLAGRAKLVAGYQSVVASNRGIVSAVENTFQVPVAKRVGRRQVVMPPMTDDNGKFVRVKYAMPLSPGGHRGDGGEVETVPAPALGARDTTGMPPVDPNPPQSTRAMPALLGWQIISMLDDRVRPKHAERHGRKYYYEPFPGERGLDEMPNPPYESPKDGGVLAYNCRCVLVPIIEG